MAKPAYVIDQLLLDIATAWNKLYVSPQDYARALRQADPPRPTLHVNTLRKIGNPKWMPSTAVVRDLEEVVLRNPLPTEDMRRRSVRLRKSKHTAA